MSDVQLLLNKIFWAGGPPGSASVVHKRGHNDLVCVYVCWELAKATHKNKQIKPIWTSMKKNRSNNTKDLGETLSTSVRKQIEKNLKPWANEQINKVGQRAQGPGWKSQECQLVFDPCDLEWRLWKQNAFRAKWDLWLMCLLASCLLWSSLSGFDCLFSKLAERNVPAWTCDFFLSWQIQRKKEEECTIKNFFTVYFFSEIRVTESCVKHFSFESWWGVDGSKTKKNEKPTQCGCRITHFTWDLSVAS